MKRSLRRTLLTAALALAAVPAFAQSAPKSPFSQTVFFGDSLTDGGYFRPTLINLIGPNGAIIGRFTTNPGYLWADYLSSYYGGNANPAWTGNTTTTPTPGSGSNWAVGGARIATNVSGPLGYTPSLTAQYQAYLAANGNKVDPNALYTVWGGANDIFAATGAYQTAYTNVLLGGGTAAQAQAAGNAAAQAIIGPAVGSQISLIGAMTQAGARYILVPTIPDVGLTPDAAAGGAAGIALGTALSTAYNGGLYSGLASAGLHVIPVDTFHFLQEVVASPSTYGLTNVTGKACLPQPAPAGGSSLFCNPASTVPNGANTYLFADGVHPTSAAHKALGDLAIAMIDGPRSIAVLPHSAGTIGRARAVGVDAAVAGMAMHEGDGMRWWADIRGDQQRFVKSHGFDGFGGTGAFGVGWRSGHLLYGAFAGYGRQDIDFGFDRGSFRQTDASVGGFVGWTSDGLWVNGQVSWTKLGYKVDRQVNLGQAVRIHHGSPDGTNLSVGASAGWTFKHGKWEHGPLVSLLSQTIRVDGYAEDSNQSSALAYMKQKGDSLIGSAGWQASYAINDHVQPFVRLTGDHEYKKPAEQVWAQSLSLTGSLPYAVPGLAFDRTYGTFTVGLRNKIGGLDLTTAANVTVGQSSGSNASFYVTLGGSF
ncbi:autotransporter domain-containing protein [Thermomonas alba]|uniref:autotransporter domain-containing protein n=1 Tax=Thermomonas alba TaxID=2888525 RepID=UPI001F038695|nr:autotransporter domain-containing protein [Thermomonas alba]